jgi:hypothetical protein
VKISQPVQYLKWMDARAHTHARTHTHTHTQHGYLTSLLSLFSLKEEKQSKNISTSKTKSMRMGDSDTRWLKGVTEENSMNKLQKSSIRETEYHHLIGHGT